MTVPFARSSVQRQRRERGRRERTRKTRCSPRLTAPSPSWPMVTEPDRVNRTNVEKAESHQLRAETSQEIDAQEPARVITRRVRKTRNLMWQRPRPGPHGDLVAVGPHPRRRRLRDPDRQLGPVRMTAEARLESFVGPRPSPKHRAPHINGESRTTASSTWSGSCPLSPRTLNQLRRSITHRTRYSVVLLLAVRRQSEDKSLERETGSARQRKEHKHRGKRKTESVHPAGPPRRHPFGGRTRGGSRRGRHRPRLPTGVGLPPAAPGTQRHSVGSTMVDFPGPDDIVGRGAEAALPRRVVSDDVRAAAERSRPQLQLEQRLYSPRGLGGRLRTGQRGLMRVGVRAAGDGGRTWRPRKTSFSRAWRCATVPRPRRPCSVAANRTATARSPPR